MADEDRIIAVGLLTQRELDALGSSYSKAYPIEGGPCFVDLLAAIDEADRAFRRHQHATKARSGH